MKTAAYIFVIILGSAILWLVVFVLYAYVQKKKARLLPEVDIKLPKSWKELTEKQLLYISTLMINDNTLTEIQSKCFFFFSGIKVLKVFNREEWLCKVKKGKFILQEFEVLFFSKKLSFLTDGITEVNPLPKLAGQKHVQPLFKGVSFRQWFNAENYYQAYLFTKDEYYLNCLCAVIYCDARKFDINKINKRSKKFRKLSIVKRFTVFIYYSGLKDRLSKEFKNFFQRLEHTETQVNITPPNMREYIDNMLQALNLGDITKNDQLLDRDVWDAFSRLDSITKENKEIQNRLNKMKK
ncbi:hypothetical protein [Dysgonomonas sp. HGC4]|uniref:hypothetical protein n=1 Tax=Dysgonomonas sp. HGC4 TaxID=1658009 RepID=UPI000682F029|nr:hypothetical protein [Dysgonomonas sp. HGC4]MBD8349340.1 hypothetical protein [Dysgonomonas sp. HGC4]